MSDCSVIHGEALTELRAMETEGVDSIVTDPPYGLAFMGKAWDKALPDARIWDECLRVLKPGAHLVAFGGTRTYHRLTCAIEDAGFEIRDCLSWLYGSGFPKSLDVSKAIDRAAGAKGTLGEPNSPAHAGWIARGRMRGTDGHEGHQRPWMQDQAAVEANARQYLPATAAARQCAGWGTALKPAWEPIILARKPLAGTVAGNVLEHGTGALNVDGCRIGVEVLPETAPRGVSKLGTFEGAEGKATPERTGRWPANVVLDEEAALALDAEAGESTDGVAGKRSGVAHATLHGLGGAQEAWGGYGGHGGPSRFFYTAKASTAERSGASGERNPHPTVKPLALMRWLCRLVTPPGGLIVDPFSGSGTTGHAALLEGFRVVLIGRDPEMAAFARKRIAGPMFAEALQ